MELERCYEIKSPLTHKFTKEERLHLRSDFKKVYTDGRLYHTKNIVLFVLPTSNAIRRVGFVASKKVGSAVKRNRVKRLLREVYRLNKNSLTREVDMVIVAKKTSSELKFSEIENELLRLFKRAGLVKDDKKQPPFIN